jgi:cytochrome P450
VLDRYATRDTELGGAPISKGDLVTLSLAGANRDPEVFPDPDRFDPGRTNLNLQVAFAHGPHVCLGMHLARLETRVALDRALRRLPGLRLDPVHPGRVRGLVFRKPTAVNVLWDRVSA